MLLARIATDADPMDFTVRGAIRFEKERERQRRERERRKSMRITDLLTSRHPMFAHPNHLPIFIESETDEYKAGEFTGWLAMAVTAGAREIEVPVVHDSDLSSMTPHVFTRYRVPIGSMIVAISLAMLKDAGIAESELRGMHNYRVEILDHMDQVRITAPVGIVSRETQQELFDTDAFEPA